MGPSMIRQTPSESEFVRFFQPYYIRSSLYQRQTSGKRDKQFVWDKVIELIKSYPHIRGTDIMGNPWGKKLTYR